MIYGEILKIITFYHFDSDPRFPPFLLYVRWKSGVNFVWRCFRDDFIERPLSFEVKGMQIQPSKPKWEITNITNRQNTKRTYSQPSEQLFPKRWPLSNRNRTHMLFYFIYTIFNEGGTISSE